MQKKSLTLGVVLENFSKIGPEVESRVAYKNNVYP